MYQFIHALTYDNPGTLKNDVINLNLFEKIVQNLELSDGTTKKLAELSPKYKNLRNSYNEDQEKDGADNIIDNNEKLRDNPVA